MEEVKWQPAQRKIRAEAQPDTVETPLGELLQHMASLTPISKRENLLDLISYSQYKYDYISLSMAFSSCLKYLYVLKTNFLVSKFDILTGIFLDEMDLLAPELNTKRISRDSKGADGVLNDSESNQNSGQNFPQESERRSISDGSRNSSGENEVKTRIRGHFGSMISVKEFLVIFVAKKFFKVNFEKKQILRTFDLKASSSDIKFLRLTSLDRQGRHYLITSWRKHYFLDILNNGHLRPLQYTSYSRTTNLNCSKSPSKRYRLEVNLEKNQLIIVSQRTQMVLKREPLDTLKAHFYKKMLAYERMDSFKQADHDFVNRVGSNHKRAILGPLRERYQSKFGDLKSTDEWLQSKFDYSKHFGWFLDLYALPYYIESDISAQYKGVPHPVFNARIKRETVNYSLTGLHHFLGDDANLVNKSLRTYFYGSCKCKGYILPGGSADKIYLIYDRLEVRDFRDLRCPKHLLDYQQAVRSFAFFDSISIPIQKNLSYLIFLDGVSHTVHLAQNRVAMIKVQGSRHRLPTEGQEPDQGIEHQAMKIGSFEDFPVGFYGCYVKGLTEREDVEELMLVKTAKSLLLCGIKQMNVLSSTSFRNNIADFAHDGGSQGLVKTITGDLFKVEVYVSIFGQVLVSKKLWKNFEGRLLGFRYTEAGVGSKKVALNFGKRIEIFESFKLKKSIKFGFEISKEFLVIEDSDLIAKMRSGLLTVLDFDVVGLAVFYRDIELGLAFYGKKAEELHLESIKLPELHTSTMKRNLDLRNDKIIAYHFPHTYTLSLSPKLTRSGKLRLAKPMIITEIKTISAGLLRNLKSGKMSQKKVRKILSRSIFGFTAELSLKSQERFEVIRKRRMNEKTGAPYFVGNDEKSLIGSAGKLRPGCLSQSSLDRFGKMRSGF